MLDKFVPLGAASAGVGPIGVAAAPPIGEVLFGERAAAEFFAEDFLDFGQGVEPGEKFGAVGAVFEAVIQFFADEFGQAGDFSDSGFHKVSPQFGVHSPQSWSGFRFWVFNPILDPRKNLR